TQGDAPRRYGRAPAARGERGGDPLGAAQEGPEGPEGPGGSEGPPGGALRHAAHKAPRVGDVPETDAGRGHPPGRGRRRLAAPARRGRLPARAERRGRGANERPSETA